MKTKIKYTLILVFCFTVNLITEAKARTAFGRPSMAFIEIITDDRVSFDNKAIQFQLLKDNINSVYYNDTLVQSTYKIKPQKTIIRLPLVSELNYGRINFIADGENDMHILNPSNNLFIFEDGDTLQMHLTKNGVIFKGKSGHKFNCIYQIYQLRHSFFSLAYVPFLDNGDYSGAVKSIIKVSDGYYKGCMQLLNSIKDSISIKAYQLISADAGAMAENMIRGTFDSISNFNKYRSRYFEQLKETLTTFDYGDKFRHLDSTVLVNSYWYCDYLLNKEITLGEMKASTKEDQYNKPNVFAVVLDHILYKYHGMLKDKLILLAAYRDGDRIKDNDWERLDLIIEQDNNNPFTAALNKFLKNMRNGEPAFPFELTDDKGKIRRLADFRGKLVLMDFWFTGCGGCKDLAEEMKPIIESYRNNPNIVFISVSIDKNRLMWLKSLEQETYSLKDQINVYTNGLGSDHEITKHYRIFSYPRLLLISTDGKILSSSPPRPSKYITGSKEAFIKLIEGHI